MFQPYFGCKGISGDSNWMDIADAPKDGTPVELENCYGIRPTYSLCRWVNGRGWVDAVDDARGVGDGPHLRWRKYEGSPSGYADPTHGAQFSKEYWR